MTGNNCLLDTSIIVQSFRNIFTARQLDNLGSVYVSTVALGELLFGAYRSERLEKHLKETENFLIKCTLLVPDRTTADLYGKTKASLMKKGSPIPDNDIWIAASAIQHNLPLYTADVHFRHVEGLQLFNPLTSI